MERYPIPSNMEGQGVRNPYSRLNTMFNPRLLASDAMMAALPGPAGAIDRFTGNRIRNFADRMTGGTAARNQREYDAYMRQMMRDDPGNQSSGLFSRAREFFGNLGGGGGAPAPFLPYQPNSPAYNPAQGGMPQMWWEQRQGTGGDMYGSGQGMMRGPATGPAPSFASARSRMAGGDGFSQVIQGDAARDMMNAMKLNQRGTFQRHDNAF
jgi:hypothetical protein